MATVSGASGGAETRPLPGALGRHAVFAGLFLLATLNSIAGQAIRSVQDLGWANAAFTLFGVSAVVWAALAAGLYVLRDGRGQLGFSRADAAVAVVVVGLTLLPFATASMAALTLLSAWAIATSAARSSMRRAGVIFLAITGALLWGRLILAFLSRPLLDLDAIFVSGLIGSQHQGNLIWYEGEAMRLVVAPGCSSMQGLSFALLLWVTVNQLFGVRFDWKAAAWCVAALAATVLINVARIASMLKFPAHFDELHVGWGYQVSMWLTLLAVGAITLWGGRKDIFRAA
jgi:exosortase/archaeosortase family protein